VDIKEVLVVFRTEDPMDGSGFRITDIPAGDDRNTAAHRIKGAAAPNAYKYGIRVFNTTSTTPIYDSTTTTPAASPTTAPAAPSAAPQPSTSHDLAPEVVIAV
jgi:hypothetical protein